MRSTMMVTSLLQMNITASVGASSSTKRPKVTEFVLFSLGLLNLRKVDENLFYKGIDKSIVPAARLQQTHSLSEPDLNPHILPLTEPAGFDNDGDAEAGPPYPFASGNDLLGLTEKHNVCHPFQTPVLIL